MPRPGVVGAQTEAVAVAHGAITKFGAAAVPLFAAEKPCDEMPVLLSPPRPLSVVVNACGRLAVEEKVTDSKLGRPLASVSKPVNSQPFTKDRAKALVLFVNLGRTINVPTKRWRWSRLPLLLSLLYAPNAPRRTDRPLAVDFSEGEACA